MLEMRCQLKVKGKREALRGLRVLRLLLACGAISEREAAEAGDDWVRRTLRVEVTA